MERFNTGAGSFALERTPGRPSALRGWSAADELVVATLESDHDLTAIAETGRPVLVVNPGPGAVPIALLAHGLSVALVSDSFLDVSATFANAEANGIDTAQLNVVDLDEPEVLNTAPHAALVVLLVPKRLALLDAQLRALRPALGSDTLVIGAGMTRHIHTSTIESFEASVGPTVTSRATRKARLILPTVDPSLVVEPPPAPTAFRSHGLTLVNDANGFSPRRVDAGTELLLANLVDLEPYRGVDGVLTLADVGCGNGIIGAAILARVPHVAATFVDESYAAVRSARATVAASLSDLDIEPCFVAGDGLRSFGRTGCLVDGSALEVPKSGSLDVVVSNPPFHHDHAVTDEIAWGIFTSAHRTLRLGGLLLIVGNRHLGYHAKLKRLFGNATVVASNAKFVVLSATRR